MSTAEHRTSIIHQLWSMNVFSQEYVAYLFHLVHFIYTVLANIRGDIVILNM